jgi:hypothetical protein
MEKNEMIRINKESNRLALKVIVVPPTMLKNNFVKIVSWKSIKIVKPFSRQPFSRIGVDFPLPTSQKVLVPVIAGEAKQSLTP